MALTERQERELRTRIKNMIKVLEAGLEMVDMDNFCLTELYKQAHSRLTKEDKKIFDRIFNT